MKRIAITHGSARVSNDINADLVKELNSLSEAVRKMALDVEPFAPRILNPQSKGVYFDLKDVMRSEIERSGDRPISVGMMDNAYFEYHGTL